MRYGGIPGSESDQIDGCTILVRVELAFVWFAKLIRCRQTVFDTVYARSHSWSYYLDISNLSLPLSSQMEEHIGRMQYEDATRFLQETCVQLHGLQSVR
jgi:hypothetical protein